MGEFHARKPNRLKDYDYNLPGAYFITVCTKDKRCILWDGDGILSTAGQVVDAAIRAIPERYEMLSIDNYVVMPNHLHILLRINAEECGRAVLAPTGYEQIKIDENCRGDQWSPAPTVSRVMQQMKGTVTKQLGGSIWQKSFHEHVIRDQNDFLGIWEYIENNPAKWLDDEYYN